MKRLIIIFISCTLLLFSCKKKEKFVEPDYIFAKWTKAIELFNYNDYKRYEAYPKNEAVFNEIYKDIYFADLMITNIEDLDEKKVEKDINGDSYVKRKVDFECAEVKRSTKKPVRLMRGTVDFVKFIDGKRINEGWLMWNRHIIRINK